MIVTINGKIVKPKTESKNKPLVSSWFKKWMMIIGGLFFLFFASAFLAEPDEGLYMMWLIIFLLCLLVFGVVITISTIITVIKKFLKFKMVIYYQWWQNCHGAVTIILALFCRFYSAISTKQPTEIDGLQFCLIKYYNQFSISS